MRNPIDAFVLAALEKKGLSPSPPADRLTLLRRVTLDLTGLPPTPEEISAFLADRAPDAYEKVVRRLLASPRYGERWAQHWLDVVRFGETNGFELDADRPQAWRYRDYVVRAFNEDRPYDRFITEQIAGDLLPDSPVSQSPNSLPEGIIATGFLRAGPQHVVGGNQDPAVNRQEWLTEAVTGVGAVFLGLTVQCARCHDHKFDPIPQKDYYRLQAFFAAADNRDFKPEAPAEQRAYDAALQALRERQKPIQDQVAAIEKPYRERLRQEKLRSLEPPYAEALALAPEKRTPAQSRLAQEAQTLLKIEWDELVAALGPEDRGRRAALRRQMHDLELQVPQPPPMAPGVADVLSPVPAVHVLLRGDPHTPGEEVQPGFPGVLLAEAPAAAPSPGDPKHISRLDLARWLTRPDKNSLTARVMVNRLWQHHFGRGIVATPNDFGRHGQAPTHPELLDWLASSFVAGFRVQGSGFSKNGATMPVSGFSTGPPLNPEPRTLNPQTPRTLNPSSWSLKALHYLMVTSSTYRQASGPDGRKAAVDPENRLLWRMNRQRLDAEALRDSVLQATGTLNLEMGGPPVRVPLEPEVVATVFTEGEPDNLWPVTPDARQHTRRSLYLLRKRNVRLPMLAVFDQPDMMTSCGARGQSVHALQALTLMNSDFMSGQSRALAKRILGEKIPHDARIERLFLLTLGRPPRPAEVRATARFLREQTELIRARIARGEPVVRLEGLPDRDPAEAAAWLDLCLATLNLNEFAYVR